MKRIFFFLTFSVIFLNVFSQEYSSVGKLYMQGENDKALELGLDYYKTDSESAELNMLIGRILTDKNQFKEATPYLEKGTSDKNIKNGIQAWSLAYLGTAYFMTDNPEKAKQVLTECIKLNATKNSTASAKKRLNGYLLDNYFVDWKVIETEHFRFHIQDTKVLGDIDKYLERREKAFSNISNFFNAKPTKKIDFYIWSSYKSMKKRLGTEAGFATSKICMVNAHYNQTSGHEIAHVLSDIGIVPSTKTAFINQGIAVYLDQTNRNRMEIARKDLKSSKVDILELWEKPENYPDSYNYTISGAFIEFLLKKGTENQLKQLLKIQTVENAEKVYDNFEELIKEFEKELKI